MYRFGFDHAYNRSLTSDPYTALAKRGFSISRREVAHPGALTSRFIYFAANEVFSAGRDFQYLEYSECSDIEELHGRGKIKGQSVEDLLSPRVSLRCDASLESLYLSTKAVFRRFEPEFSHKNYYWVTNDKDRRPGWNFLVFNRYLVPGIGLWLTEYEPRPATAPNIKPMIHHNTAGHIIGQIWNTEADDLKDLSKLVKRDVTEASLELDDGTTIWQQAECDFDFKHKTTAFNAIVLSCASLSKFIETAKPDATGLFVGRPAALLKQADNSWDIIAVEEEE